MHTVVCSQADDSRSFSTFTPRLHSLCDRARQPSDSLTVLSSTFWRRFDRTWVQKRLRPHINAVLMLDWTLHVGSITEVNVVLLCASIRKIPSIPGPTRPDERDRLVRRFGITSDCF